MSAPDLDLAFRLEPEPGESPPDLGSLRQSAGALADPALATQRWQALLACWLHSLQAELPPDRRSAAYSLGLSLVDDAMIAELNRSWRQHDGPTDVLAFAALEEAPPRAAAAAEPLELGDIVISLESAARQAQAAGQSIAAELLFLASHGLLHLLGWDHPDEASLALMLARQQRLIAATEASPALAGGRRGTGVPEQPV